MNGRCASSGTQPKGPEPARPQGLQPPVPVGDTEIKTIVFLLIDRRCHFTFRSRISRRDARRPLPLLRNTAALDLELSIDSSRGVADPSDASRRRHARLIITVGSLAMVKGVDSVHGLGP